MADCAAPTADLAAAELAGRGWTLFEAVIPPSELPAIRQAILDSVEDCGRRQVASGACAQPDGTSHHAVGQYAALDAFLARGWLAEHVSRYFDDAQYILHAFNPAVVAPQKASYLHNIHRDVRTHGGAFRLLLNMLVMVDPFTLSNGATHVLSGSQHEPDRPDADRFWSQSERLTGPAGSIVLFDSNLWHAAGSNVSEQPRAALTLSFSRAFVKQQMDYPRFLGEAYGKSLTPEMRQLLGYNAMTPTSYDEFYRPREARLYRDDQG
ncbi:MULTISPECIES: phytanoyl-CoA dioxygenase family protein [unclassified Phenylobacterium]|uniref:phytanoyl-CoA dioxygenase family protein n=1 Tax=unclassified Phenylobacterium TaxID=2640670 RepID=UPI000839DD2C|nr:MULTISPECIES: phytanoyl-CoA dioxygenase family protein [unclassified Phenylobacterium]